MVAMETTTVMKILMGNILKLFKGVKFDYDQIKEENVIRSWNFQFFLFLTTLAKNWVKLDSMKLRWAQRRAYFSFNLHNADF